MFRTAPLIAAILFVTWAPGTAWAKWTRLHSEHFIFVGDASEGDIRRVAQKLEQFRNVLTRLLPNVAAQSPVPTIVFVFRSHTSFTPYRPHFNGRAIEAAGFFQQNEDLNYIAIDAEATEAAFHIVFHEYTHFLVGNSVGTVPVWVNEGLAEVYAMFEERDGGKGAMLGLPHPYHVGMLRSSTPMPLRDLMAVEESSSVYNEGNRRTVFYAQSWALMHYFIFGNPSRAAQLTTYLAHLKDGENAEEAFRNAFRTDIATMERELRDYVRRYQFLAVRVKFPEKVIGAVDERGVPIDETEAGAYLGDLLARIDRADDARVQFQKLIASNPQSARANYGLGLLELRSERVNEALPLLERAVTLDANDAAYQTALGGALLAKWNLDRTAADAATTLERARAVLLRSLALDSHSVHTVVMLGRAELASGTDIAHAASLLDQAVKMAPAREYYRLLLSACLLEQREFEKARAYLGPLVARGSDRQTRDAARRLLATIASPMDGLENDRAAEGRNLVATRPEAAARAESPQSLVTPVLRKIRDGETRVLGLFSAVDCRGRAVVFHIEVEGRSLHLSAPKLDGVEFISYRSDSPGTVACGAIQPKARVLATYQPAIQSDPAAGDIAGRLVAIELLPDGYTPDQGA